MSPIATAAAPTELPAGWLSRAGSVPAVLARPRTRARQRPCLR